MPCSLGDVIFSRDLTAFCMQWDGPCDGDAWNDARKHAGAHEPAANAGILVCGMRIDVLLPRSVTIQGAEC
jgi:hypothetical protein